MPFTGGYIFRNFEGSAEPVLGELPVAVRVFIPREYSMGSFIPIVTEGSSIRAGEKLLQSAEGGGMFLVSPVSGIIEGVTEKGVTIVSDGSTVFESVGGHGESSLHRDRDNLFTIFCSSGCAFLLDRHFSSLGDCECVRHIIINGVHNGPLDRSWNPGIGGDTTVFLDGLRMLRVLFPGGEITIAMNRRNKRYLDTAEVNEYAAVRVVSDRYPKGHPELLSRDILHRRLISPEGILDGAILVIPFFTVVQVAEVMTRGRPLVDRILMIGGPGVSRPGWYRVRIGTPFEELRRHLFRPDDDGPWRIIRGDLFTGEVVSSLGSSILPTDREISVIREHAQRDLFRFMNPGFTFDSYARTTVAEYIPFSSRRVDSGVHGGVRPCVQCNYCDEVCPVDIYPQMIWKYVTAGRGEESFRLRPWDCIGCRLCDYVCPSKIDISHAVEKAKEEYRSLRGRDEKSH